MVRVATRIAAIVALTSSCLAVPPTAAQTAQTLQQAYYIARLRVCLAGYIGMARQASECLLDNDLVSCDAAKRTLRIFRNSPEVNSCVTDALNNN